MPPSPRDWELLAALLPPDSFTFSSFFFFFFLVPLCCFQFWWLFRGHCFPSKQASKAPPLKIALRKGFGEDLLGTDLVKILLFGAAMILSPCSLVHVAVSLWRSHLSSQLFVFSLFSCPLAGCQGPKPGTLQMSSFSIVSPSKLEPGVFFLPSC